MRDGFVKAAAGTPKIRVADCEYNAGQIIALMEEAAAQGVKVLALPELCVTGYTCGDLFLQPTLLDGAERALARILEETRGWICSPPWACRSDAKTNCITAPQ